MARIVSRRATQVLLVILALFLIGTVAFLSAVNAYFSIDKGAIILSQELGTWQEIAQGSDETASLVKSNFAQLAEPLTSLASDAPLEEDQHTIDLEKAMAKSAAEAAKKAGFGDDGDAFVRPARNNTPTIWNALTDPPEKIPRIIHQTWKDKTLPPNWQAVRDECAQIHPDYKYMLWTDADSRQFIVDKYPWFLSIFDAYPYAIQRADAIRYFILHYYGGIYMDLDVGCLRRFDPLLRFEVVLPKTIPVGVSNDVMASAQGHPFMDHLIHNLVTFNHRYLTHYPTVMFSTGPMFVSASYGLYVDAHGLAKPSTPDDPSVGFTGIRILPKSLYGKNAKPSDAPNAFFQHFYGSSWHANDADFLIFLRKNGKLLIFVGFLIALYGLGRGMIPRLYSVVTDRPSRSSRSTRRGRWIPLPFVRDQSGRFHSVPTHIPSTSSSKHRGKTAFNPDTALGAATSLGGMSSGESGGQTRVAAPRPQRMSIPLFQLQDGESAPLTDEDEELDLGPGLNAGRMDKISPNGILNRMWDTFSSGSSRPGSAELADYTAGIGGSDLMRSGSTSKDKAKSQGIFYLPAYFVGGGGSSSSASGSSTTDSNLVSNRILEEHKSQGVNTPSSNPPHSFWNISQPHNRHFSGGGSSSSGFSNWAASFLPSGSSIPDTVRAASPTLQSMLGNLSGRTPSPTMHLASLSHALHSNRAVDDLESRLSVDQERPSSNTLGVTNPTRGSLSIERSRSIGSSSSTRPSVDVDRPPPYEHPLRR